MFVYWGYWDSGKGHMKKYAKMNSKTVIFYDNNSMRKIQKGKAEKWTAVQKPVDKYDVRKIPREPAQPVDWSGT